VMIFGTFAIMATPNGLGTFPAVVSVILGLEAFGSLDRPTGNALGWIMWGTQEIMILSVGVIVMILIPVFNRNNKPVKES
jgi:glycosyltransferase 2 family protein